MRLGEEAALPAVLRLEQLDLIAKREHLVECVQRSDQGLLLRAEPTGCAQQHLILVCVDVEVHLAALPASTRASSARARCLVVQVAVRFDRREPRTGRSVKVRGCGEVQRRAFLGRLLRSRFLGLSASSGAFEPLIHVPLDQELPLVAQRRGAALTLAPEPAHRLTPKRVQPKCAGRYARPQPPTLSTVPPTSFADLPSKTATEKISLCGGFVSKPKGWVIAPTHGEFCKT